MREIVKLNWQDIDNIIDEIAPKLLDYKNIYPIPRGGLIPAVILSHKLEIPITDTIDNNTLIIDDICDSGLTIKNFLDTNKVACLVTLSNTEIIYGKQFKKNTWIEFPWENPNNTISELKDYENKRNI
jgi:hypoxanthine phosphoribosyltransferase